jgi:hypothetical protein
MLGKEMIAHLWAVNAPIQLSLLLPLHYPDDSAHIFRDSGEEPGLKKCQAVVIFIPKKPSQSSMRASVQRNRAPFERTYPELIGGDGVWSHF